MADATTGITAEESKEIESSAPDAMDDVVYVCPGERIPISRAVHLSRLSTSYALCRDCQHRHDVGYLPVRLVERIERGGRRAPGRSLLTPEGVRGVYLNEFTRADAGRYAAAFASILWKSVDRAARPRSPDLIPRPTLRGPAVVVGHDARASSPDLATGVVWSLRRNGCQVIDVGQVSGPCCSFAVEYLQAAGGIHVSGARHGPSWNGLDFAERRGVPWSEPGRLLELEPAGQDASRPTRRGGGYRAFACEGPYVSTLWKHFHAVRPLRVGVACGVPRIRHGLEQLFDRLPCDLTLARMPVAEDRERVAREVSACMQSVIPGERQHVGVWIDDDGQTCQVFDESGARLSTAVLAARMIECLQEEAVRPRIVLDSALQRALDGSSPPGCAAVDVVEGTREATSRAMWKSEAGFGCESVGRFWFQESVPTCDALVTLGKLLQLLSRSDRPASALRRL